MHGIDGVRDGDGTALARRRFLKGNWRGEANRAVAGVGDELAKLTDFEFVGALECNADLLRVVARRDGEYLLNVVAGGAQLHVDAGVHVAKIDAFEGVQALGVFCLVAADEVADARLHRAIASGGFERAACHAARSAAGVDEGFAQCPAGGALRPGVA